MLLQLSQDEVAIDVGAGVVISGVGDGVPGAVVQPAATVVVMHSARATGFS